jgi:anaerobic magnesium-protoporphyrin IX monomethyl ester cyclase
MVKIALIKPPPTYADWYRRPVLGISYISSFLKKNGFSAKIFDAVFNGWSEKELVQNVEVFRPDIIGITAMTHEVTQAARLAAEIKKRLPAPTVIGGSHVTALPERTLSEFGAFDYGIRGEGEKTFLELLRLISGGGAGLEAGAIPGLIFRHNGSVKVNEPGPWLTEGELEQLPYPAFEQYYGENRQALAGKHAYYVMFSARGCPYSCAFCMQVLGRQVRSFSTARICDEIQYAVARYGAHTIDFADEIFLFDSARTREILNLMIEKGLPEQIRWSGLTRANMVNRELIALAKRAGCYKLEMGVESGDDGVLNAIGKKITVEQVKNAVAVIKQNGIRLGTYFILGHPNETPSTVRKTVRLAVSLNTDTIAVGVMVPYPGTAIYSMAKKGEGGYRLLSENWADYDKYGGKSMEFAGMPYKKLTSYQKRAYIGLYLKNFRLIDLFIFILKRRRSVYFFIQNKIVSMFRMQVHG